MKRLYDENGNRVHFFPRKVISRRTYSAKAIYRVGENTALKVYKQRERMPHFDVLREIRDLNPPAFYDIYDFYYDKKKQISALTMKYYESCKRNLITSDTALLAQNILALAESMDIISEKGIVAEDFHSKNLIIGKDDLTVIDADFYTYFDAWDETPARIMNRAILKNVIMQILYNQIGTLMGGAKLEYWTLLMDLFRKELEESCDMMVTKDSLYDYFDLGSR